MSALHEIQSCFRDAILCASTGSAADDIRTDGLSISRRLGIYRNNVFTNQREALRTIYCVVERLVGGEFFKYLTDEYVRRYASPAGDLNRIGEHMAEFLAEFPAVSELIYLPDTARLEWLAHQAYHGPEHAPLALERLQCVAPERYEDLRFRLHPASGLLASDYPVHRIWQVNQADYTEDSRVNLDAGGIRLLIERRHTRVELRILEEAEWLLLQAMAADRSLGAACDEVLALYPDFDLDGVLSRLIAESSLVDFELPDTRVL